MCKANLITTKLEKLLLELLLWSKPNFTYIHRTNSKFQHNAFMKILCYKYSTSHMCQRRLFPPSIEKYTFCVLSELDNHYAMESFDSQKKALMKNWIFSFNYGTYWMYQWVLFTQRFKPGTFCMLSARDNSYTTETSAWDTCKK